MLTCGDAEYRCGPCFYDEEPELAIPSCYNKLLPERAVVGRALRRSNWLAHHPAPFVAIGAQSKCDVLTTLLLLTCANRTTANVVPSTEQIDPYLLSSMPFRLARARDIFESAPRASCRTATVSDLRAARRAARVVRRDRARSERASHRLEHAQITRRSSPTCRSRISLLVYISSKTLAPLSFARVQGERRRN